ncbi:MULTISPECIES: DUF3231 family protein [Clostridia]|uniref:DUF3231 family protein n=1 Tax=Clostridia TaxID=186801 RepID=UPI000EA22848|nr:MULTISPECIES: DUF3231 family protein [Clostridia]NBJ70336.1 DUF3231 family protein [Roseburia sp. 1XD42-34]RKI76473.1 DUF3231 family protein [Clostridium sp. 1xD42-85]
MKPSNSVALTASDISPLWDTYQSETIAKLGIVHFLKHAEDRSIRQLLKDTLKLIEKNLAHMEAIFAAENVQIPLGFTEKDIHLNAPRLFSDILYLEYIYNMTFFMMSTYSLAFSVADHKDISDYYATNLKAAVELNIKAKELEKEKGVYIRSPRIPKQKKVSFVQDKNYLTGWFGERRPLLGIEITNLVFHSKRNALGHAVITGFSQVAHSKEVRKFFERGRDISGKHLEIFTSILHEDHLADGALLMTSEVTESTIAPFSDRLMVTFVANLIASSIGQYGVSMSISPRHDLGVQYARLMTEVGKYANEGMKLLIRHEWLEQPPMAANRNDLAK